MQPSRRQVFAGATIGLAAACTTKVVVAPPSKDQLLAGEAASREAALLQLYTATIAAFPALSPALEPLRGQHDEHRRALGEQPLTTPPPTADPALVGRTPQEARRNLAALERDTAASHAAAVPAAGRALAQVLASLSACEAAHAVVLR